MSYPRCADIMTEVSVLFCVEKQNNNNNKSVHKTETHSYCIELHCTVAILIKDHL